jgi:hypothetical protein
MTEHNLDGMKRLILCHECHKYFGVPLSVERTSERVVEFTKEYKCSYCNAINKVTYRYGRWKPY